MAEIEHLWQTRFESIPKDYEESEIYTQAGSDKLSNFHDVITVDNFAKQYGYTHEQVFSLEWNFVYELQYIHGMQANIQREASKIRQRRNKRK